LYDGLGHKESHLIILFILKFHGEMSGDVRETRKLILKNAKFSANEFFLQGLTCLITTYKSRCFRA